MSDFTFEGFEPANTTPVPDVLFDELLTELSGTELKVLLYVIRRTLGFKKSSDGISLTQFTDGITTKDGRVLDKGCGIKKRSTVSKILRDLIAKGCIESEKGKTDMGDDAVTIYRVHFKGVVAKSALPSPQTSTTVVPDQPLPGSAQIATRGSADLATHKKQFTRNSLQETDKQEGTYSASDENAASANAQPAPASSQTDSYSLPTPAATSKPASQARSEQDSVAGDTRSQQTRTTSGPVQAVGYEKPVQATLTGAEKPVSAKQGPVDVTKLTIKAHVNLAFKWLDAVRRKAEQNPQASYVQNRTAEKLVRELIEAVMNTPNELTERNVHIAWMAMWKSPAGKDGFTWGEPGKISIAAFCRNYGEYLARGLDSLAKAQQKQSQKTKEEPSVLESLRALSQRFSAPAGGLQA